MSRAWPDVDLVLVVPQFHYDVAYLQTEEAYYPRCFANFRAAIALMETHQEYRYTIESPFLVEQFRQRCPEDFARLMACHERGQLEVSCALWVVPDMNYPCGEALIRQVQWGRRWAREVLGVDSRVAWIADSWGHASTLPQVLAHAGITAYLFTRGMRPDLTATEFLWVSPDGTELPTHWLPGGYAALRFPAGEDSEAELELARLDATEDNLTELVNRFRPRSGQGTMLCCSGGDFVAPQATAPAVVRGWQSRGLPVRFGSVREYAEALCAHADALPREHGEFNPLLQGSQGTRIRLKQGNRHFEYATLNLERLHACLALAGRPVGPLELAELWGLVLKNQFHDIACGTLVDEAAADVARDYDRAGELVEQAEAALVTTAGVGGVFNPSAYERTEWVWALNDQGAAPVTVPALGWAPTPEHGRPLGFADAGDEPVVLSNDFWQVTVGVDGTLTSVIDQRTGREYVPEGGPGWGDLVYRLDNGDLWLLDRSPLNGGSPASHHTDDWVDDPYRESLDPLVLDAPIAQHGRRWGRMVVTGQGEQFVEVEGTLAFWQNRVEFTTTVALRDGDPLIHFTTVIKPSGRRYRLYTCFPTGWPEATARHQVAYGVQARDQRRYVAHDWAEACAGDGHGVRLLNAGLPGHALHGGVLSLLLFRSAAMEYKGPSETAYEEGVTHVFRYAVRPFSPEDPGHADREGERLNRQLLELGPGTGPASPLNLSGLPEQVTVGALYAVGDGEYILRLHEHTGHEAVGRIGIAGLQAAWTADGMDEKLEAVALEDGALPVRLRPWQLATWRVRCR